MEGQSPARRLALIQEWPYRAAYLIFALPLLVLSGIVTILSLLAHHRPQAVFASIARIVVAEFMAAVFALCLLVVLWVIAAPRWVEANLASAAIKAIVLGASIVFGIVVVTWFI